MKTVDTTGLQCPRPLIMLKEALQEISPGEQVTVTTDNDTSLKNLVTYLRDQGVEPTVTTEGRVHRLVTSRPEKDLEQTDPERYCDPGYASADYVVCIRGTRMGDGDPELGSSLMETFVDHLKLQKNLPTHVVLYNGGVKLAMKQSPVCAALNELEELGTRIVLCGTCVDHFGIQYELGVGMISNMMVITETLASAGHVIYP